MSNMDDILKGMAEGLNSTNGEINQNKDSARTRKHMVKSTNFGTPYLTNGGRIKPKIDTELFEDSPERDKALRDLAELHFQLAAPMKLGRSLDLTDAKSFVSLVNEDRNLLSDVFKMMSRLSHVRGIVGVPYSGQLFRLLKEGLLSEEQYTLITKIDTLVEEGNLESARFSVKVREVLSEFRDNLKRVLESNELHPHHYHRKLDDSVELFINKLNSANIDTLTGGEVGRSSLVFRKLALLGSLWEVEEPTVDNCLSEMVSRGFISEELSQGVLQLVAEFEEGYTVLSMSTSKLTFLSDLSSILDEELPKSLRTYSRRDRLSISYDTESGVSVRSDDKLADLMSSQAAAYSNRISEINKAYADFDGDRINIEENKNNGKD